VLHVVRPLTESVALVEAHGSIQSEQADAPEIRVASRSHDCAQKGVNRRMYLATMARRTSDRCTIEAEWTLRRWRDFTQQVKPGC